MLINGTKTEAPTCMCMCVCVCQSMKWIWIGRSIKYWTDIPRPVPAHIAALAEDPHEGNGHISEACTSWHERTETQRVFTSRRLPNSITKLFENFISTTKPRAYFYASRLRACGGCPRWNWIRTVRACDLTRLTQLWGGEPRVTLSRRKKCRVSPSVMHLSPEFMNFQNFFILRIEVAGKVVRPLLFSDSLMKWIISKGNLEGIHGLFGKLFLWITDHCSTRGLATDSPMCVLNGVRYKASETIQHQHAAQWTT